LLATVRCWNANKNRNRFLTEILVIRNVEKLYAKFSVVYKSFNCAFWVKADRSSLRSLCKEPKSNSSFVQGCRSIVENSDSNERLLRNKRLNFVAEHRGAC